MVRRRALVAAVGLLVALAGCGQVDRVGVVREADTPQCASTVVEGVDVFGQNGAIDWSQVQASGRGFAFVKASQGDYLADSTFAANFEDTKAAGLLRSPFHFFDGTIDGVTQAQYFLDVLNGEGGLGAGDLPPMLDLECPTDADESQADTSCEGTNASGWVDTATLSQRIYDWLDTVEQATGRKPIIYSYPSWFESVGLTDPALAAYPLYIASYDACADVPAPWSSAVFWQYSEYGTVPGIEGDGTDLDRFFGSDADLQQFVTTSQTTGGVDMNGVDLRGPEDLASDAPDLGARGGQTAHAGCHCDAGAGGRTDASTSLWCIALASLVYAVRRRVRRGAAGADR